MTTPWMKSTFFTSSLGTILAFMELTKVRSSLGKKDILFAAGLPDSEVPQHIRDVLAEVAQYDRSYYYKYEPDSPLNDRKLAPDLAKFHEKHFGTSISPDLISVAPASTPVLEAMIYATQEPGKCMLVLWPDYPVLTPPAQRMVGRIDRTARLVTPLDLDDQGKPYGGERWQVDWTSFREALDKNRKEATLLNLTFPGNPTGFSPLPAEYQQLVEILLYDIKERKSIGLPPCAILEDTAYALMAGEENVKFYSIHNAIDDLRKATDANDKERLGLLDDLEQSIVSTHSFSKDFAVPGKRAGYFMTKNPEVYAAVYGQVVEYILTFGSETLATTRAILDIGEVDKKEMEKYARRLRFFEQGFNELAADIIRANPPQDIKQNELESYIRHNLPVPAKADFGFFSLTRSNFLGGMRLSAQEKEELLGQIAMIPDKGLRSIFDGVFNNPNNEVTNSKEAALLLLVKAGVLPIPIPGRDKNDTNIYERFSVGGTDLEKIKQAFGNMRAAFIPNQMPSLYRAENASSNVAI